MTPDTHPVILPDTCWFDLAAEAGGEPYRIFLARPRGPAPEGGFPVIYMLDGNAGFATFVEVMRRGMVRPAATGMGEAVIVGIGYPDGVEARVRRSFDYTAGPGAAGERGAPETPVRRHGGRDAFLAFIEAALKPCIARMAAVDPARSMLFGHSLAGWFVLDVMARDAGCFAAYVAVSPSIWWDEARLDEGLAVGSRPVDLALMVGEWEQALAPWQQARPEAGEMTARRAQRGMVDRTRAFAERVGRRLGEGSRVRFELLAGEDHASVLPPAMARALRLVLAPATVERV